MVAAPLPADPAPVTLAAVWAALETVHDPEIPVVSVVDLGIVQNVALDEGAARIRITPTFSGCPALDLMRQEIQEAVAALGIADVRVDVALDPPWSSDRIRPEARERMKAIGLAPPPPAARYAVDLALTAASSQLGDTVACPFCGSSRTVVENSFGPTICRSLLYCHACQQPFEQFKAL